MVRTTQPSGEKTGGTEQQSGMEVDPPGPTVGRSGSQSTSVASTGEAPESQNSRSTDNSLAEQVTSCPECGSRVEDTADGHERVCTSCGLVVDENRIDHGPEWRSFDDNPERNPKRTGPTRTVTRHDNGLSTQIGRGRDANDNSIAGRKKARLSRQRRLNKRFQRDGSQDRDRIYAFAEIRRVTGALDLPYSVRERSCSLYEQCFEADLLHGRDLDAFVGATIYAACRFMGLGRTFEDFEPVVRADKRSIRGSYQVLNVKLRLEAAPPKPVEYLPRIADGITVTNERVTTARRLLKAIEGTADQGRTPAGVAAAALYYVDVERGDGTLNQTELGELADVTSATIRDSRDAIREYVEEYPSLEAAIQRDGDDATGKDTDCKPDSPSAQDQPTKPTAEATPTNGPAGEVVSPTAGIGDPDWVGQTTLDSDAWGSGECIAD